MSPAAGFSLAGLSPAAGFFPAAAFSLTGFFPAAGFSLAGVSLPTSCWLVRHDGGFAHPPLDFFDGVADPPLDGGFLDDDFDPLNDGPFLQATFGGEEDPTLTDTFFNYNN